MKNVLCCLVIAVLVSSISNLHGQSRTDSLPRALERKIHWMEKRGFPARDYSWNEPTINKHLQQALAHRPSAVGYTVGGSVLAGSGVVLSSVGFIGFMVASIVNQFPGEDMPLARYGVMSVAGLAATGGGVVMMVQGAKRGRQARNELHSANELYQSSYLDKGSKRRSRD